MEFFSVLLFLTTCVTRSYRIWGQCFLYLYNPKMCTYIFRNAMGNFDFIAKRRKNIFLLELIAMSFLVSQNWI